MKYIIHIGTNKTGTSTLQSFLHTNSSKLETLGICYPNIGMHSSAHHELVTRFKANSNLNNLQGELSILENKFETAIFSSESFHTLAQPERLLPFFPKNSTNIVVYIREHATYLSSWYQQAIQARNTSLSFEEFIQIFKADYCDLVKKWVDTFGRENIHIRLYERDKLVDRDIVSDFLANFLQFDKSAFQALSHDRNPSIAGNLLYIKKILNQVISKKESLEIVYEILELSKLKDEFKGKIDIGPDMIQKIAYLYREDRKQLKKEYNIDINPAKEIKGGHMFPDFDTLNADLKMVYEISKERNYKIAEFLDRIRF